MSHNCDLVLLLPVIKTQHYRNMQQCFNKEYNLPNMRKHKVTLKSRKCEILACNCRIKGCSREVNLHIFSHMAETSIHIKTKKKHKVGCIRNCFVSTTRFIAGPTHILFLISYYDFKRFWKCKMGMTLFWHTFHQGWILWQKILYYNIQYFHETWGILQCFFFFSFLFLLSFC